jgi:hypothetical protein
VEFFRDWDVNTLSRASDQASAQSMAQMIERGAAAFDEFAKDIDGTSGA